MSSANGGNQIRRQILALVGKGHSVGEIAVRLGPDATEQDVEYASILVRVRDSLRSDKLSSEQRPAPAGA
jgi:hypothetical protein